MTAEAVADAGLERVDQDVVRAPAIPVGIAEEHRQFPGTMWVSEDTFRNYVGEAVESLAHHGFDRIVIVNGHGGNVDALREVGGQLTRNGDAYVVPFTWFEGVGEHTADMGHGGPSRRDSCATSNRTAFERSGSTRPGPARPTAGATGRVTSTWPTTRRSLRKTESSAIRTTATPSEAKHCSS